MSRRAQNGCSVHVARLIDVAAWIASSAGAVLCTVAAAAGHGEPWTPLLGTGDAALLAGVAVARLRARAVHVTVIDEHGTIHFTSSGQAETELVRRIRAQLDAHPPGSP